MTDVEAPVILNIPADITEILDSSSSTVVVTWTEPSAIDNSGEVTLTSSHASGSAFPVGDTTVTYTAVDGSSNEKTQSFNVRIQGQDNGEIAFSRTCF